MDFDALEQEAQEDEDAEAELELSALSPSKPVREPAIAPGREGFDTSLSGAPVSAPSRGLARDDVEIPQERQTSDFRQVPARVARTLGDMSRWQDRNVPLHAAMIGSGAQAAAGIPVGMAAQAVEHPVAAAGGAMLGGMVGGPAGAILGGGLGAAGASAAGKLFGGDVSGAARETAEQLVGPAPGQAVDAYRQTGSLVDAGDRFMRSGGVTSLGASLLAGAGAPSMYRGVRAQLPGRVRAMLPTASTRVPNYAGDFAGLPSLVGAASPVVPRAVRTGNEYLATSGQVPAGDKRGQFIPAAEAPPTAQQMAMSEAAVRRWSEEHGLLKGEPQAAGDIPIAGMFDEPAAAPTLPSEVPTKFKNFPGGGELGYRGPTQQSTGFPPPSDPIGYDTGPATSTKVTPAMAARQTQRYGDELVAELGKRETQRQLEGEYRGVVGDESAPPRARAIPGRVPLAAAPENVQVPRAKAAAPASSADADVIAPVPARELPAGARILRSVQLTTPLKAVPFRRQKLGGSARVDATRADKGLNQFDSSLRKANGLVDLATEGQGQAQKLGDDMARAAWGMSEAELRKTLQKLGEDPRTMRVMSKMRAGEALTQDERAAYVAAKGDIDKIAGGADALLDEADVSGMARGSLGGGFWPVRNRTVGGRLKVNPGTADLELPPNEPTRIGDLKQSSLDYSRKAGSVGDTHDALELLSYFDDLKADLVTEPVVKQAQALQDRYLQQGDVGAAQDTLHYVRDNVLNRPRVEDMVAQSAQIQEAARTPIEVGASGSSSGLFEIPKADQWRVREIVTAPDGETMYRIDVDGQPHPGLVSKGDILGTMFEGEALKGDPLNQIGELSRSAKARYLMFGHVSSAARALAQNAGTLPFAHSPGDLVSGLRFAKDAGLGVPEVVAEARRAGIPLLDETQGPGERVKRTVVNPAEAADIPFQLAHYGAAKAAVLRAHPDWTGPRAEAAAATLAAKWSDLSTSATKATASRARPDVYFFQGPTLRQASLMGELMRQGPKGWAKAGAIQGVTAASMAALYAALGGDWRLGVAASFPVPFVQPMMMGGSLAYRVAQPVAAAAKKVFNGDDLEDKDIERALSGLVPPGVRRAARGELVRPAREE